MFNNISTFKSIFIFVCFLFFVGCIVDITLISSNWYLSQNVILTMKIPNTSTTVSISEVAKSNYSFNAKLTTLPTTPRIFKAKYFSRKESRKIRKFNRKKNCRLRVCSIGNLGNQIWEYMSLFVVWRTFSQSDYRPYIELKMWENLKVFFPKLSIPPDNSECEEDIQRTIPKSEPLEKYATWFRVNDNERCETVYLDEYSSRYEEILDYGISRMRQEMFLSPELVNQCQNDLHFYKKMFKLENEDVTFVGMHYRGTDYVRHLQVVYSDYHVRMPDHEYYLKAMKYFSERYRNVIFILSTIDNKWLSRNRREIVKNGNVVINPYMDDNNPDMNDRVHDLVILSSCNHSIINYGTFGTTAALFAGGTTFVYDLKLPLDHRGATLAMGIAQKLKNWHAIS